MREYIMNFNLSIGQQKAKQSKGGDKAIEKPDIDTDMETSINTETKENTETYKNIQR